MRKLLHAINLGDAYERQARLAPALLAVLPVTILAIGIELHAGRWVRAIGLGAGLEVVLAVAFSKLAHAMGRVLEVRLKRRWGGLPTTTWLMPDDPSRSTAQKALWRAALGKLAGLDLEGIASSGDARELRKALDDAILTVRHKIRNDRRAAMLRQHNIYYGFARNLAGFRWVALALSALSLAGALAGLWYGSVPLPLVLVEALFVVVASGFACVGVGYVRHCAERYAEFFLTTADAIAKSARPPGRRSTTIRAETAQAADSKGRGE